MAVAEEEMLQWLTVNETAKTMLKRVLERQQPSLTPLPPLHRVSLHGGHVLEVAGPSGSGKSELLLQAVVSCILPEEWQGLRLGGSQKPAVYIDLDCHFDMLRLVKLLQSRVQETQAMNDFTGRASAKTSIGMGDHSLDDLITTSLKRFYLKRCFNSFEFLVTLKTIRPQLKYLDTEHGSFAQLLVVDSIGAFYWLDRAVRSVPSDGGRKTLSLHSVSEVVVRELSQLLRTYPNLLLMTTKAIIHNDSTKEYFAQAGSSNQSIVRNPVADDIAPDQGSRAINARSRKSHREYMPAAWQSFVTHRLLLQGPFVSGLAGREDLFFTAKWDLPPSEHVDRFVIYDGLYMRGDTEYITFKHGSSFYQKGGIKLANTRGK